MVDILEKLFDSPYKARLLKLLFRNPGANFSAKEIADKIQNGLAKTVEDVDNLLNIDLIRKKKGKGGVFIYAINPDFPFFNDLSNLVLKSSPTSKKKILRKSESLGRIKLLLIAGKLINSENYRADILIVGEGIPEQKVDRFIKEMEAEVGATLDFVLMETEEFHYRQTMFDRFIRDILEKPHEKLINKLDI